MLAMEGGSRNGNLTGVRVEWNVDCEYTLITVLSNSELHRNGVVLELLGGLNY